MEVLRQLEQTRGDGTSMITLHIPGKTNLPLKIKQLNKELGTAVNIKDRANRQSVLVALKQAIYGLKTIKVVPENGIAVFAASKSYV